jgi:hypothetical protein
MMKKLLIFTLAIFCIGFSLKAQVNPHAIGLRLGGNGDVSGAELTFQKGLSKVNRLEFDLGFSGNSHQSRFFLAGIYQWDWNITDGLNWYVGPGAGIGVFSYDETYENSNNYFNLAFGGQIGLEYDFNKLKAPILLSLDFRPMWNFAGYDAGLGWGMALGVRYTW